MKRGLVVIACAIILVAVTLPAMAQETGLKIPGLVPAPKEITTRGPEGDVAVWYDKLELTAAEVAKVRSMNLKAAYEYVTEIDWDKANLRGFQDACKILNIQIVGIASAELDPVKQKANMENFMGLNPDIITCQPQDLDVAAPTTFAPLVKKGIKLVFLSNVPKGFKAGRDYVAGITDSLVDMGYGAADMMAEAMGGSGDIITDVVAGVNYVCNTRDGAFVKRIKEKYPNIHIVKEGGFQAMKEAGPQASGLLTRYPSVKGIYVSFSNPAIDVLEAVRTLGRSDVKIITMDLDTVACVDMAQGGNIYGIVADSPYSMGFGRAILGAYGALGKKAPKYVASPAFNVTKKNVAEAWKWSFGENLPDDVQKALQ
jgi:ribose transport system substrate-binding protein